MNRIEVLAEEIRAYCAANANPQQAARYARYFKEGYDSWGLMDGKHELWTRQVPAWAEQYRDLGVGGYLELGKVLFKSGKYEEGSVAIHLLAGRKEEINARSVGALAGWFEAGIGNWAHTDVLCGMVIAPLLESGRIGLKALAPWRKSAYKYQRRAVPVAMLGLLKKEESCGPWLEFLRPLMLDGERVVQQGLGWYLRETWKKQPEHVEAFLLEWKDLAPRLIFQYATEKMGAAGKARFRKTKAARG
ncbi:MAG: DNA alkylation repair protein [Bryobacteraceae bacterium]|nr:DNA alkylation repair protein [Bryobacteraceae bacterium]